MIVRRILTACVVLALSACRPALPDDLPSLVRAMADNDMNVHTEAARKVQKIYGVDGLLIALASPDARAKVQAARFLRLSPDPRARGPLLEATGHADPHVRGYAAYALSRLPSPQVEARLRELQRDESLVARSFATQALDVIKESRPGR